MIVVAGLNTIQMLGLAGALSYGIARVLSGTRAIAFHRYAIVCQPRSGLPEMPRGFRVEELDRAQLARHSVDIDPAVQARRFDEGLTCLGSFDLKGRLTGLIWLRAEMHLEDEVAVRFILPAHCCWDTGLWVAPQFRLGRSLAALWAGAGNWMDRHGAAYSLSRVSDYNLAALLSHRRMGAVVLAHHSFLKLGSWQWSRRTSPRLIKIGQAGSADLDLRLLDLA